MRSIRTIFTCCIQNKPKFLITYAVAGEQKKYSVCDDCIKINCFKKYVMKKEPICKKQDRISGE